MKRVYCTSILKQGSTYELEKKYYIHLVKVMRLKVGDHVSLFNNTSGEWKSEIVDIKNNFLTSNRIRNINGANLEDVNDNNYFPKDDILGYLKGENVHMESMGNFLIPMLNFSLNNFAIASSSLASTPNGVA